MPHKECVNIFCQQNEICLVILIHASLCFINSEITAGSDSVVMRDVLEKGAIVRFLKLD